MFVFFFVFKSSQQHLKFFQAIQSPMQSLAEESTRRPRRSASGQESGEGGGGEGRFNNMVIKKEFSKYKAGSTRDESRASPRFSTHTTSGRDYELG